MVRWILDRLAQATLLLGRIGGDRDLLKSARDLYRSLVEDREYTTGRQCLYLAECFAVLGDVAEAERWLSEYQRLPLYKANEALRVRKLLDPQNVIGAQRIVFDSEEPFFALAA